MERGNYRAGLHVAQQSRREKLRVLHHPSNHDHDQNVEVYSNNLDQFSGHDQGLVHHIYSSEMLQLDVTNATDPLNFSSTSWKSIPSQEKFDSPVNHGNYQELIRSSEIFPTHNNNSQNQYGGDMHNFYHKQRSHKALSLSLSSPLIPPSSSNDMGAGNSYQSVVGPLGPFTGYATILKSSKFLRPAQQLLDEFCNILGPINTTTFEASDKVSNEIRCSKPSVDATAESLAGALAGDSGGSPSTFLSSNDKLREAGGGLSSPIEHCRPEFLQKKAKLLYMLEEVCRRYKHYHQQMQMVVSSFETVAGLSAATPYISLALKAVSKHFRSLKNAISDQLKNVRTALGEDLSSLTTTTSSSKGETTSSSQQKLIDQTIQNRKSVGGNLGFFEPQQQHVWKPQRGLPERAVAILRAWLFDHFLHPYPTDADKHMLSTQTGLTRNQVSNWFINARVRVWKPMVEEIHTLESKTTPETGSSAVKSEGKAAIEGCSRSNYNHSQTLKRITSGIFSDKQKEFPEIRSSAAFTGNRMNNADSWNLEKRSRLESTMPGTMDGSLVGLMPYQQSGGIDIGGLGAVSLTLGLRQNAEGVQQQYPLQQENQLRRHFGDQIIYDFVG